MLLALSSLILFVKKHFLTVAFNGFLVKKTANVISRSGWFRRILETVVMARIRVTISGQQWGWGAVDRSTLLSHESFFFGLSGHGHCLCNSPDQWKFGEALFCEEHRAFYRHDLYFAFSGSSSQLIQWPSRMFRQYQIKPLVSTASLILSIDFFLFCVMIFCYTWCNICSLKRGRKWYDIIRKITHTAGDLHHSIHWSLVI